MSSIPEEFDIIKTGHGYTMKGWDFNTTEIRDALKGDRMLNPAFELASNSCPWDCGFCFTEDPNNPEGLKKALANEMTLDERLHLIDQARELGTRTINIVGAGEPTIDPSFWQLLEHTSAKGITPIVYTEGALRLTNPLFAKRLYDLGATVVLKVNSLENEDYQNHVVNSGERKLKPIKMNYFHERNKALEVLLNTGFARHDPTRLAFDTIICRENYEEIPRIHQYARDKNIFVLFVNYLPSGRSSNLKQNAISQKEQFAVFDGLARIDKERYGISHRSIFPYAGGTPCSIRGLGLYVKIQGSVYDCPGEAEALGNVREESLQAIWKKTTHIRQHFDGGCLPRELFWKRYTSTQTT